MRNLFVLLSLIISSNLIAFDELHCFRTADSRNNYISNLYSFSFDSSNNVHIQKTIFDHKYNSRITLDEVTTYKMIYNDTIIDIKDNFFSAKSSQYHFRIYLKDAPTYISMKDENDRYLNSRGYLGDKKPYNCKETYDEALEILREHNKVLNNKYTPVTFE